MLQGYCGTCMQYIVLKPSNFNLATVKFGTGFTITLFIKFVSKCSNRICWLFLSLTTYENSSVLCKTTCKMKNAYFEFNALKYVIAFSCSMTLILACLLVCMVFNHVFMCHHLLSTQITLAPVSYKHTKQLFRLL